MSCTSTYTDKCAAEICRRIANGESLVAICRDEKMPHRATVMRWLQANEHFRKLYAEAHDHQAEFYANQIVEIADEVKADRVAIDKARLRIDARKWTAAKLLPKKYGDKLDLEHSGTIGLANALEAARKRVGE